MHGDRGIRIRYFLGPGGKRELIAHPDGLPVIVDVLMASSTIVAALWAGAEKVIPAENLEKARSLGRLPGAVLVGERSGIKVRGFDYNNSPLQMLKARLAGKTVVISTSHGTRVMVEGGIIASTLNAIAVDYLIKLSDHVYLLASGTGEDLMAAKFMECLAGAPGMNKACSDAELIASKPECKKLLKGIRRSPTGIRLSDLGLAADVDLVCTAINKFPIIPVYRNGYIVKYDA